MKKILVAVFSIMMLLGFTSTTDVLAKQGQEIKVKVDGEYTSLKKANVKVDGELVETDMPSVLYKSNTLVPGRIVSEKLGAEVKWDEKTKVATIIKADKKIEIEIDSSKAMVNGKEKNLPVGALVKLMRTESMESSRTMVPFRFIAEELGAKVEWEDDTRTAVITSNKEVVETPEKPQEPVKPEVKLNKIKSITSKSIDGSNVPQIHIEAENDISYKDVSAKNANKIVIEMQDSELGKDFKENIKSDVITDIKAEKLNDKDVKITINLKKQMRYQVLNDNNKLKINFEGELLGIERQTIDGKEAIVVKNTHTSKVNSFILSNPQRVVVDIRNTNLNNVGSQISTDIIKELRLGQYTGKEYDPTEQVARIVLDINEDYENPKYTTEKRGDDLIIFVEGTKKAPVVTPPTPPVVQPPTNNNKPSTGQKTIVIDAGHGGSDGGAAANGIREKDVALKVSLKVEDKLKALGYKVLMTRTTDVYPSLAQRYKLANDNNADAFLSIHFNSATPAATGIETLWSNKNSGNKAFAQSIQNELIKNTNARDRGLKSRNDLAVLNGTKGISALAELGFISNPKDAQEIKTESYLEKCANAIVNGIHNFFSK